MCGFKGEMVGGVRPVLLEVFVTRSRETKRLSELE
jgi:hypothetical protein